jgi:hypothetical protein
MVINMRGLIIKDIEMPQKCGQCKLFHAEHPMYCTVVEGHRTVGAPYGMPRPDWCPLVDVKTVVDVWNYLKEQIEVTE